MASSPRPALHRVVVVAFDRISAFHLSVPCVVFGEVLPPDSGIALQVCSAEPGPLAASAGFTLGMSKGLAALRQADTVIVPSWRDPAETPPAALLSALRAAHRRGARIVGLCLGAYALAAAGLLEGRRATTHWAWAEDFARRHPGVAVAPDVLYIDEGDVLTSAGTAAGLDCCLYLLRRLKGAEIANEAARRLVTTPHRAGGQAQFIPQPLPDHPGQTRLGELLDWVRGCLDQAHSLDSLAQRALMSRRTFTRQFRRITGGTVGEWLLRERLALAQRLLESGDQPVEQVAALAGLGSSASLRHHFRRAFGVAPLAWRRAFRGETA